MECSKSWAVRKRKAEVHMRARAAHAYESSYGDCDNLVEGEEDGIVIQLSCKGYPKNHRLYF